MLGIMAKQRREADAAAERHLGRGRDDHPSAYSSSTSAVRGSMYA
jgi:hypothetical protein